jgi:hypothetical protein
LSDNANQQPPLLAAHDTFVRVLRIARFDGLSILWVAGSIALVAAASGNVSGAVIGSVISAAGAMELHGVDLLRHGRSDGVSWLIRSQLFLLLVMFAYCALRITHFDLEPLRAAFHEMLRFPIMKQGWEVQQSMGITEEKFLRDAYIRGYLVLAFASLIYQGGMTIYYARRRTALIEALAAE